MNIVYIVPSLERVGPTNVVLNLVRSFNQRGNNIFVISLRSGELLADFEKYSDVIISNNYIYIAKFLSSFDESTIIHSHGIKPDFINYVCGLFMKYKSISTIHNFIELDYCFLKGKIKGRIFTYIHKYMLRNINASVSCSKSAMLFNNVSEYYVYNGVDDKYQNIDKCKNHIKIAYVGSFNKRKNIRVILDALTKTSNKNITLIIIGDGDDFFELKKKYEGERVIFTGRVTNPFEIANECDYIVSSSLAEGFPLAILESLSCGLNYILSDIPPHREIDKMSGKIGYLVNNSVEGFLNCFNSIKTNEHSALVRDVYENNFTIEIMADRYNEFYNEKYK